MGWHRGSYVCEVRTYRAVGSGGRSVQLVNVYSKPGKSEQGWGKNVRTISRGGRRTG